MATWNIDKAHSEVQFKVKHLVISTVTGAFNDFDGQLVSDSDNLEGAKINLDIDVNSIDTKNADRDGHLKSPDFFAAAEFPKIVIKVDSITKKSADEYVLHSKVNIKGVEKPVDFNAELGGITVDPYGQTKMGLEVAGKINRQEFGLTWSAVTEAGGLVVSDDVKLVGNVQFVKA
ncbi:MAG: YceI family protein [Flavobacteriia bacterium]|nr:YceI family protein [Flavobacteriia bacterium]OJX35345.1 MAG: hypothetical protein BGO87_12120 [Flavobacteriia bacterium 40-80]